jgi:hypothetical protein
METHMEKRTGWALKRGRVTFEVEGGSAQDAFDQVVADAKELQAARKELARFKDVDPVAMQKQIAELTRLVADIRAGHHKDAKALAHSNYERRVYDGQLAGTSARIDQELKAYAVGELQRVIESRGADAALLIPYVEKNVLVVWTGPGYIGTIADENGNPLVSDLTRKYMTFQWDVDNTLKTQFPSAFPPQ